MKTTVVNVKVDPQVKKQAQEVADELGLSLSAIVKAQLKQLIRTKTVNLSAFEEPSGWALAAMQRSEADVKAGRVSPAFESAEDAIAWLNDPNKQYENQIQQ